jgi:hypothetical protein
MKKMFVVISAVLIGMASATGVSATMLDAPGERKEGTPTPEFQALVRSYRVLGQIVKGSDDRDLGRITQILLDPESGQAVYVIMTSGGVLGIAQEDRLVPWQALRVDSETYDVTMALSERQFKQAPKRTIISSESEAEEIHRYFGVAPRWPQEGGAAGQPRMEQGMDGTEGSRMQEQERQQERIHR